MFGGQKRLLAAATDIKAGAGPTSRQSGAFTRPLQPIVGSILIEQRPLFRLQVFVKTFCMNKGIRQRQPL